MLITFSGLDGSGKSTLIEWLKETLENDNQRVVVSHMYYDVGLLGTIRRLIERTTVGNKGRTNSAGRQIQVPGPSRRNSFIGSLKYRVIWNKQLRLLLYPIDVFLFLCYRFYVETWLQQILIMDRYFYDTLADVTENQESYRSSILSWLAPTPDLPIYLEISPDTAFARNTEFSVEGLKRRWLSYQRVNDLIPELVVLSTEQDPAITQYYLASALRERMVAH